MVVGEVTVAAVCVVAVFFPLSTGRTRDGGRRRLASQCDDDGGGGDVHLADGEPS